MIDHVSIAVRDLRASARFYQIILEPLGYAVLANGANRVGFGRKYPEIWLNERPHMAPIATDTGAHVCLRSKTTAAINAFHSRAIENGGTDDGSPGRRQATMVTYYAAFVRDLDGNRIEVMTVPPADGSAP